MSRTKGAKDKQKRKSPVRKPRVVKLTQAQVDLANKMGVPLEVYAKEYLKVVKKPRKVRSKVNWENLAKDLQKALRDEILENQEMRNAIEALQFKIGSLEHQIVGFQAVISYLESKSANDTV